MAARWSNPSGSIGVHRFRVWPADEDQYNHIELAQNWEKADAMIGVSPDGSEWPPTTGVDGGLYSILDILQSSILPIGMMMAWIRPSSAIPLPIGFAICDGTTLSSTQHDFTGGGNITLPDLRNRFIIGADVATTIGQAAVTITDPDIDTSDGAPGPQGASGSNTASISAAAMPSHTHGGSTMTGWSPIELMWYTNDTYSGGTPVDWDRVTLGGNAQPCHGQGGWTGGQHRHKLENLSVEGSGAIHENRPAYAGLIWIMKVKNIG